MIGLEEFLMMFGFTKDSTIVAIVCMLVLLGNFTGGLVSNILVAHGGPIRDRSLFQKTSFRLALVSELILVVYAVYYHLVLISDINMAQVIYWVFTLLAAPLLAALGAQATYLAFSKKIDQKKAAWRKAERAERAEKFANGNGE